MSRLTKKLDEGFYVSNAPCTDDLKNKLGKFEDLQDELGCPLDVVFKALKDNHIIFKHVVGLENPKITFETHRILGLICIGGKFGLELCDGVFGDEFYVDTKDYQKTWWLKVDWSDINE